MITCDKKYLEARCQERGYSLDEVMPCVVSQDGDLWTIDESHAAYPRPKRRPAIEPPQPSGPGTELKKLLKTIGITASPTCSCNARAAQMDEWGPDVCEQKIPEIVDWLAGEAKARRLPFIRLAGEQVVKLAIRRARRSAAH